MFRYDGLPFPRSTAYGALLSRPAIALAIAGKCHLGDLVGHLAGARSWSVLMTVATSPLPARRDASGGRQTRPFAYSSY